MTTPLVPIAIMSSYKVHDAPVLLPKRMASATADMKAALFGLRDALRAIGGDLVLSDLFRSYDMQLQAHLDFVNRRKTAFSPPPGGSFHEAGRACDIDLSQTKAPLETLWRLAAAQGMVPIIDAPDAGADEAWHFERRGSHQRVYEYYKARKATNFDKPYKAAAASAILAIGVQVDRFGDRQVEAALQAGLIRLGNDIGNIDGQIGPRSNDALRALGLDPANLVACSLGVEEALQRAFPEEYFDAIHAEPVMHHA